MVNLAVRRKKLKNYGHEFPNNSQNSGCRR
jgi:hypothetical protein